MRWARQVDCTSETAAVGAVLSRPEAIRVQKAGENEAMIGHDDAATGRPPRAASGRTGQGSGRTESTPPAKVRAAAAEVTVAWLAAGACAVVVLLLVLGALARAVQGPEVDALDRYVSPWVHQFASPPLDGTMLAASFVGSGTVLVPLAVGVAAWLLYRRRFTWAFFVVAAEFGSILLNEAIKTAVHRPRPALAWSGVLPDYSFPSGHSMNSLALFLALAIVVWALRGHYAGAIAVIVAVVLSLLIGVSRIYLGAHFLTDVVGGYTGAVLWLLAVGTALAAGSHVNASRARRRDGRSV